VVSSTAVEDAFFVAQGSALRAVAAGHPQSCAATVNHVASVLGQDLLDPLARAAQEAARLLGQGAADGADQAALASALGAMVTQSLSGVAAGVADGASRYMPLGRISGGMGLGGLAGGSGGGGGGSGSGGSSADSEDAADLAVLEGAARKAGLVRAKQLVALNNLEAASSCARTLAETLRQEVRAAFEPGHSQRQLEAVVQVRRATNL
jgi:hypothetical protein